MYIGQCFIRKNTEKLRNKLNKIGIKPIYIQNNGNTLVVVKGQYNIENTNINDNVRNNIVDCHDNEKLFLAIAALQTDTDKNQLFVLDENVKPSSENFKEAGSFVMCKRDTWNIDLHYDNINISTNVLAHKATVPELIEHFIK